MIDLTKFKPRENKPVNNPYFITEDKGGYSPCIKGKPMDESCNVLANCVGYAVGRFNEIAGENNCDMLCSVDAGAMLEYASKQGLEWGFEPKLGGCMVWRKTGTAAGGHVAIVERICSPEKIVISESGYNSYDFRTRVITKGDNWNLASNYIYAGCIYNPTVAVKKQYMNGYNPIIKPLEESTDVKCLQLYLNDLGYDLVVDGIFGTKTSEAVTDFQDKHCLETDGVVGYQTWYWIWSDLQK